jgi:biopolymer transport protein ExbB/TolQ
MTIEHLLYDIATALRYPVLVLALIALIVALAEVGTLLAELRRRRERGLARLERAIDIAKTALATGDGATALRAVRGIGFNPAMEEALAATVEQRDRPDAANRIAKRLAEYDYRSVRRLERTRILVRMGPALGLMGTLIPLSPALAGLANGNVQRLTDNLRVAFSVTVAGLLVGAIAYAVSLVRNRMYDEDYSDVEYVAASLAGPGSPVAPGDAPPVPAHEAGGHAVPMAHAEAAVPQVDPAQAASP